MILRDRVEGVHGGWSIGDDGLGRVPSLTAEEGALGRSLKGVEAGCGRVEWLWARSWLGLVLLGCLSAGAVPAPPPSAPSSGLVPGGCSVAVGDPSLTHTGARRLCNPHCFRGPSVRGGGPGWRGSSPAGKAHGLPGRPSAVHMGPIHHARVPGRASALLSRMLPRLPASSGCSLTCWVRPQLTHSSGWVGGAAGSPALLLWVIIKDIGRTLSVKAAVLWTFTSRDPPGLAPSSPGPRVCHTGLACAHLHASA